MVKNAKGCEIVKKLLFLLLCLTALLLTGCQEYAAVVPPSGSDEDYYEWNQFLWDCKEGVASTFNMIRTKENGQSEIITISYDGAKYSITDAEGTREYAYLLPINHIEDTADSYIYGDYFFLTDDPKMTYERYQRASQSKLSEYMELILPTELVLGYVLTIPDIPCFGDAPDTMDTLLSLVMQYPVVHYSQSSIFFKIEVDEEHYQLVRYNHRAYNVGTVELTATSTIKAILELDNGGFCMIVQDQGDTRLLGYDPLGEHLWTHRYPANQDITLRYIFEKNDHIYFFGIVDTDPSNYFAGDIYVAQFALNGTLVKTDTYGGSRDEQLNHVEMTDSGFRVYGNSCSADGDFPFSPISERINVSAQVSWDLTLSDAIVDDTVPVINIPCGFLMDQPIYMDDPRLIPDNQQLPETAKPLTAFTWQNGYVILWLNQAARYPFSDSKADEQYHCQLIATFYTADGQALWQTVSDHYLQ